MAQKRFSNQTVIVTGAGEGIGYEVARQFCHMALRFCSTTFCPTALIGCRKHQRGNRRALPGRSGETSRMSISCEVLSKLLWMLLADLASASAMPG